MLKMKSMSDEDDGASCSGSSRASSRASSTVSEVMRRITHYWSLFPLALGGRNDSSTENDNSFDDDDDKALAMFNAVEFNVNSNIHDSKNGNLQHSSSHYQLNEHRYDDDVFIAASKEDPFASIIKRNSASGKLSIKQDSTGFLTGWGNGLETSPMAVDKEDYNGTYVGDSSWLDLLNLTSNSLEVSKGSNTSSSRVNHTGSIITSSRRDVCIGIDAVSHNPKKEQRTKRKKSQKLKVVVADETVSPSNSGTVLKYFRDMATFFLFLFCLFLLAFLVGMICVIRRFRKQTKQPVSLSLKQHQNSKNDVFKNVDADQLDSDFVASATASPSTSLLTGAFVPFDDVNEKNDPPSYVFLLPKPLPSPSAAQIEPPSDFQSPQLIPAQDFFDEMNNPIVTTVNPAEYPTLPPVALHVNPKGEPSNRPTNKSTQFFSIHPDSDSINQAPPKQSPTTDPITVPTEVIEGTTSPESKNSLKDVADDGTIATTIVSTSEDLKIKSFPRNSTITAPPQLQMGPMVGHTSHNSVTLWGYHEWVDYTMEILLYDSDTSVGLIRKLDMIQPSKDKNNAIIATLDGLKADTQYEFGMHINGVRVGKGSFRTAPLPDLGCTFDYVLTSCMNHRQYKNQMVWGEIPKILGGRYPDFTILAGDTVYLQEGIDVTSEDGVKYDRVWYRNYEQRKELNFAKYIRNTPMYATWNDHEYGSNNANYDQKGKEKSLKAWTELWANPGFGDKTSDDGVYYSYYWGDVHYIVTDDHWYRDPSKQNRLGEKQTKWLKNNLITSRGTFKVIVIGSDIMQRGWSSDLINIGTIVRENSINGVIFHSGDIHRNEFKRAETGGFPYPVTQITSSGIAKVWRRPFVLIKVNTMDSDPSMTARFYGASTTNDVSTWTNDPNLKCSDVIVEDRGKEHTCTEMIRLSDLTVK